MATSPPTSPAERPRPRSALIRPPRSSSRLSTSSKQTGSRASDEDVKTSVQVGKHRVLTRREKGTRPDADEIISRESATSTKTI